MRKRMLILAVVLVLSITVVACGNSSNGTSGASSSQNSPSLSAEPTVTKKPLSDITIGFSISTLTTEFFVAFQEGIERQAEAYGIKVIYQNADGDPAKQLNQIEQLVSRKVDAIILSPIDTNGIIPVIKKANEANIPIIAFDRTALEGNIDSFVRSDNFEMAGAAAKWMAEQLKERYGEYKGNIVNLQGLMSSTPGQERDKGFLDVLNLYPDINIIATQAADFDQTKGFDKMMSIIQANRNVKIDGVLGANDENVLGALQAIKQQNLFKPVGDPDHIFLTGIDGSKQALEAIRNGEMDITVSQHPIQSAEATVQLAIAKIYGKDVPKDVRWPYKVISKENIDSEEVKQYGLWPYSMGNKDEGNVRLMKGIPIYLENGQMAGDYRELYEEVSK